MTTNDNQPIPPVDTTTGAEDQHWTRDQFVSAYWCGSRDFRGIDLSGLSLIGEFLVGTDLTDANLKGTDLRGAVLHRVSFVRANLEGANLGAADLDDADLTEANLAHANLYKARIIKANFANANISGATLPWAGETISNEIEEWLVGKMCAPTKEQCCSCGNSNAATSPLADKIERYRAEVERVRRECDALRECRQLLIELERVTESRDIARLELEEFERSVSDGGGDGGAAQTTPAEPYTPYTPLTFIERRTIRNGTAQE